jgi:threonine dehydrogenase-like Zn-dependent dehydrogenase
MKALVCGDDGVRVAEVSRPEARGETVVRVVMSGICNTDVEIGRGYAGFRGTLGHEFVGALGGARVVGEINAGCGACALCASGDARHCAGRTVLGIVNRDGAHAEYVRLPARNLLRVPDAVSDRHAVFAEPVAAACAIVERVPIDRGTRVAVVGDGKLGLLAAQVLAARGAKPLLIGKHLSKLAIAEARGIDVALVADAASKRGAFDVVVEASGAPAGFETAIALLKPRGTLVLKSTFHGALGIDTARVVVDEITIVGSRCGRMADALPLLEARAIDVEPMISDVLPLGEGERAMARAQEAGVLKVLLEA